MRSETENGLDGVVQKFGEGIFGGWRSQCPEVGMCGVFQAKGAESKSTQQND